MRRTKYKSPKPSEPEPQNLTCKKVALWTSLLVLFFGSAMTFAVLQASAAEQEPVKTEAGRDGQKPADSSTLLKLLPESDELREPTLEEIVKLGTLWPNLPSEENAAYYFAKAAQALEEYSRENPEPAGSAAQEAPYEGDADALVRYVQENKETLTAVEEGLSKARLQMPHLIMKQTGTPGGPAFLNPVRNLARFLSDAGFAAELQGQPDAAAERYLECIRMGTLLQENSILITVLVGSAVQTIGSADVNRLVANASLTPRTLEKVIATSRSAETTPDSRLGMLRQEANFGRATIAMSPQHALAFADYDAFISFAEKEYAKPLPELLRSAESAAKDAETRFPISGSLLALALLVSVPRNCARHDLEMRGLQIRAAIALHEKQRNAPPDRLDALVPDFLPEVPIDPYSGKPLRYARTADGWKLWSVGEDQKDDGGEAALVEDKEWVGPDFVYTDKVKSNVERRSKGAIKTLPTVPHE